MLIPWWVWLVGYMAGVLASAWWESRTAWPDDGVARLSVVAWAWPLALALYLCLLPSLIIARGIHR